MVHSELYSTILSAFKEAGWSYNEVEGREVVRAGFEAHHTRVELHVQSFPQIPAVSVVAESPRTTTDPVKRERLAELAMRVNQTLTVGNFEIAWDSGRMFFRATNLFPTPQGDRKIIQGLVHNTVGEMDRISALEAIVYRADGPELASLDLAVLLDSGEFVPDVPAPDES